MAYPIIQISNNHSHKTTEHILTSTSIFRQIAEYIRCHHAAAGRSGERYRRRGPKRQRQPQPNPKPRRQQLQPQQQQRQKGNSGGSKRICKGQLRDNDGNHDDAHG